MFKRNPKILKSEKGLTLIEILASLVIIVIIITPLANFYLQSIRANVAAHDRLDATYIAQHYMEEIYNISQEYAYVAGLNELSIQGFTVTPNLDIEGSYLLSKEDEIEAYRVEIELSNSSNLARIVVKIFNYPRIDKLEAQMETLLPWIIEGVS